MTTPPPPTPDPTLDDKGRARLGAESLTLGELLVIASKKAADLRRERCQLRAAADAADPEGEYAWLVRSIREASEHLDLDPTLDERDALDQIVKLAAVAVDPTRDDAILRALDLPASTPREQAAQAIQTLRLDRDLRRAQAHTANAVCADVAQALGVRVAPGGLAREAKILRARLADREAEIEALGAKLYTANARVRQLTAENDRLHAENSESSDLLARAEARIAELEETLRTVQPSDLGFRVFEVRAVLHRIGCTAGVDDEL